MGYFSKTERLIMFALAVMSVSGIATGVKLFLKSGYSQWAVISLSFGGYTLMILVIVTISSLCMRRSSYLAQATPPRPLEDHPPEYRITWRREFMEKSPEHLKVDLERHFMPQRLKEDVPVRRDVIQIWTTDSSVEILGFSTSASSSSFHSRPTSVLPTETNFEINDKSDFDEGLPTYDQALTWQ